MRKNKDGRGGWRYTAAWRGMDACLVLGGMGAKVHVHWLCKESQPGVGGACWFSVRLAGRPDTGLRAPGYIAAVGSLVKIKT